MQALAVVLSLALAACSGPISAVPCEQNSNCDLGTGGTCVPSPGGSQWCAYPDQNCTSGLRYSEQSVGDGLAGECVGEIPGDDAGVDAQVDALGEVAFTVIYGDQWWEAYDGTHNGWFLLLANGAVDPDLSTIHVVSVSDTHPTATFRVAAFPTTGTVTHGRVAGMANGDTANLFTAAIPEPRERTTEGYLELQVLDAPFEEFDYQVLASTPDEGQRAISRRAD